MPTPFKACLSKMGESVVGLREEERELLARKFEDWSSLVSTNIWQDAGNEYVIVFLPTNIANFIAEIWEKSASSAYFLEKLAIALCLCGIESILGKERLCLPLPPLTASLKVKLESLGVPCQSNIMLKHAIFTYSSLSKSCKSCILEIGCPKKNLQSQFASF